MLLWHEILLNDKEIFNITSGKMKMAVTGWQKWFIDDNSSKCKGYYI